MIAQTTYPFALPPLPYAYDALEPYVDEATMHFHHDKHLKTYVDNLNKALEAYPQYHTWTLETLLTKLEELPDGLRTAVRNNGGGSITMIFSLILWRLPGRKYHLRLQSVSVGRKLGRKR